MIEENVKREQRRLEMIKRLNELNLDANELLSRYDIETKGGLERLEKRIQKLTKKAEEQTVKKYLERISDLDVELKEKNEMKRQQEIQKMKEEKEKEEQEAEKRHKKLEEEFQKKEQKKLEEKEKKEKEEAQFQEELMKQRVSMFMRVEKKVTDFDPNQGDWKKIYEEYLQHENQKKDKEQIFIQKMEESYNNRLNQIKEKKERFSREYMQNALRDDSYYEALQKRNERTKTEVEEKIRKDQKTSNLKTQMPRKIWHRLIGIV